VRDPYGPKNGSVGIREISGPAAGATRDNWVRPGLGPTPRVLDPFRFLLIALAGWMNQRQLLMIDYLREENRVLREQLGGRRLRLNDDQRRRLAARAKRLGRKVLAEVATPDLAGMAPETDRPEVRR
jgi:hypothetical protein